MITSNYRKIIQSLITMHGNGNARVPIVAPDGTTVYVGGKHAAAGLLSPSTTPTLGTSRTTYGIRIGSGTTTPTVGDYTLTSQITSSVSVSSVSSTTYYDDNGNPYAAIIISVANSGDADVTVAEIGSFQNITCATTEGGSTQAYAIMLDHTLLDGPVTIPPGESATITYTLKGILS